MNARPAPAIISASITISIVERTVYDVMIGRSAVGGGTAHCVFDQPVATCISQEQAINIRDALLSAELKKYTAVR